MKIAGFTHSIQAFGIVTVNAKVFRVFFRQAINVFINAFETVITMFAAPAFFRAKVGVKAATVPRIWERLGFEADTNAELLAEFF